jgi:uncharacterized membrane protein
MKWLGWIAATLLVAAVVHLGSLLLVPPVIMHFTMAKIAQGGHANEMRHGARPSAAARGVVRPSPDLLYSTCVLNLSQAAGVRVTAHDMPKTYWSISIFDGETNNIFVLDDRQAKGKPVEIAVVGPDGMPPLPGITVHLPGRHGLLLVRTLIDNDAHLAAIDKARRNVTCAAYQRKL